MAFEAFKNNHTVNNPTKKGNHFQQRPAREQLRVEAPSARATGNYTTATRKYNITTTPHAAAEPRAPRIISIRVLDKNCSAFGVGYWREAARAVAPGTWLGLNITATKPQL